MPPSMSAIVSRIKRAVAARPPAIQRLLEHVGGEQTLLRSCEEDPGGTTTVAGVGGEVEQAAGQAGAPRLGQRMHVRRPELG